MPTMLVDEDPGSFVHMRRLLGEDGVAGGLALEDPDRALEAAGRTRLVIVDRAIPRVDGTAFARRPRAMSGHAKLPIVIHAADSCPSLLLEALGAGAADLLSETSSRTKPGAKLCNLAALSEAVSNARTGRGSPPARS